MDDDESPKIVPLFQSAQNFLSIFKVGCKPIFARPITMAGQYEQFLFVQHRRTTHIRNNLSTPDIIIKLSNVTPRCYTVWPHDNKIFGGHLYNI